MNKDQTAKPKKSKKKPSVYGGYSEPEKLRATEDQKRQATSSFSYAAAIAHLEIAEALFRMLSCQHPDMQYQRSFVRDDDVSETPIPETIYTCAACGFNSASVYRYHPLRMNHLISEKLQRLGQRADPAFAGVKRYVALVDSDIAALKALKEKENSEKTTK